MMEVLMILLILSFSGIFLFVVYMNHLNKLIDKLETEIGALQYQTDDALHDIDIVNRNVIQCCASLKRLEDEKIDAAQNLESLRHDATEEPQEYPILCLDRRNNVWIECSLNKYVDGWDECVEFNEIVSWIYINDLLPKGGKI